MQYLSSPLVVGMKAVNCHTYRHTRPLCSSDRATDSTNKMKSTESNKNNKNEPHPNVNGNENGKELRTAAIK